jgi:hypothetical protein
MIQSLVSLLEDEGRGAHLEVPAVKGTLGIDDN